MKPYIFLPDWFFEFQICMYNCLAGISTSTFNRILKLYTSRADHVKSSSSIPALFHLKEKKSRSLLFVLNSFLLSLPHPYQNIRQFVLILTVNIYWTLCARLGARWGSIKVNTHTLTISCIIWPPQMPQPSVRPLLPFTQTADLLVGVSAPVLFALSRIHLDTLNLKTCLPYPYWGVFTGSPNVRSCSPESQNYCAVISCEVCHK